METQEFIQVKTGEMSSLQGHIDVAPVTLIKLFGKPERSDSYKVSGEYIFTNYDGKVVRLYDWKSTNLYDSDCQTPEEFWAQINAIEFHVGAVSKKEADEFIKWLKVRLDHEGAEVQSMKSFQEELEELKATMIAEFGKLLNGMKTKESKDENI